MEQQRNTEAHYRHHRNNLRRCLLEKCGIGAAIDTKYFRESDFSETERNLLCQTYTSQVENVHIVRPYAGVKSMRPGFVCVYIRMNLLSILTISKTRFFPFHSFIVCNCV